MQNIILIGYRGTGKTTVARRLAECLGVPVVDCDTEIEIQAGKTIADIFAQDGEPAFRVREAALIADILDSAVGPIVLSTGGGAVMNIETRKKLRAAGQVVWLTARPETILARLRGDAGTATKRPQLTELPPLEEIQTMLDRRQPLYAETAHSTVATDQDGPENIVETILKRCLQPSTEASDERFGLPLTGRREG